jgi:hypothetical protein
MMTTLDVLGLAGDYALVAFLVMVVLSILVALGYVVREMWWRFVDWIHGY